MAERSIPTETKVGVENKTAKSTKQENVVALQAGCLYSCVVTGVDTQRRRFTVITEGGVEVPDCEYAAGTMAPLFGVENVSLPSPGVTAILWHTGTTNYVMGVASSRKVAPEEFKGRSGVRLQDDKTILPGYNDKATVKRGDTRLDGNISASAPGDTFPGEKVEQNGLGTVVRMLLNMQQVSAGGLAKIEACLTNDMIRIVDNHYVHHTCCGDTETWSVGRTTMEEHATGYQHEADGMLTEQDASAPFETIAFDPIACTKNKGGEYSATGRWRWSQYKGFLGDMIHQWVTSPTEVYSTFMEGARRAGNFRSWIGADGTYMVQAAAGIHFQVTPWIIIPEVKKAWNDPEIDIEEAMSQLDAAYLQIWGEGPDWTDLLTSCWQMNTYLRYISEIHSLARWRQLEKATGGKFCKVPYEDDTKLNESAADEEDKKTKTGGNYPHKGQASVDIYPDGSIALQAGSTMTVVMNQGNIQIACPGNLELKAGHTVSISGKFVSIQSTLDMELVSMCGKFITKARTAWKALCEKGRMWLKSDAKWHGQIGNNGSSEGDGGDSPTGDMQNAVELNKYGIFLDASESGVLTYANKDIVAHSKGGDVFMQAESGKAAVIGRRQVQLISEGSDYKVDKSSVEDEEAVVGGERTDQGKYTRGGTCKEGERPTDRVGSILIRGEKVGFKTDVIGMTASKVKVNDSLLITEERIDYKGGVVMDGRLDVHSGIRSDSSIEIGGGVRAMGGFMNPMGQHVGEDPTMTAPDVDKADTEDKICDELRKEAVKLTFEKDAAWHMPELEGPYMLWQMRDWNCTASAASDWHTYKKAPYQVQYERGGYDPDIDLVEQKPDKGKPQGGERVLPKAPWPGETWVMFQPVEEVPSLQQRARLEKFPATMESKKYSTHVLKDAPSSNSSVLYKYNTILNEPSK